MSNRRKLGGRWGKREPRGVQVNRTDIIQKVEAPDDEKVLIKQVPAVVPNAEGEKVSIGTANIYDDGSVDVIIDDDAPQWAVDLIKATEAEMAYHIGPDPKEN